MESLYANGTMLDFQCRGVAQADTFLCKAQGAVRHLELYLKGLRAVQRGCVQDAVGHLPMDAVVCRFSEIWLATDRSHIKIMRKTGKVVETPVRLMMRLADWAGGKSRKEKMPGAGELAATLESDLIRAASRLRQAAVDPSITLTLPTVDPATVALLDMAGQISGSTGGEGKTC